MEDPILNRDLGEVKELQTRWGQYRDFVTMAMKGQPISAQAEMKFLELKSRIAMLHDSFMNALQHDQKVGQNMMNILNEMILLKKATHATDAEKQKFEFDWNEIYLLISETVSGMDEEVKRLAGINERAYKASQRRELMKARIKNFFGGQAVKYLIGLLVLAGAIYGFQQGYGFQNLHDIGPLKPVYNLTVNKVWRPLINHDYEFHEWNDIPLDEGFVYNVGPEGQVLRVNKKPAGDLTYDYFVGQELPSLLMPHTVFTDMKAMLDKKKYFLSDRLEVNGNDARYYYILMPTSDDAKKLTDIWLKNFDSLNDAQKKEIRGKFYIFRKANAIFIGISPEVYRIEYIQRQYEFPPQESISIFGM